MGRRGEGGGGPPVACTGKEFKVEWTIKRRSDMQ